MRLEELDTPALAVDLDILEANLRRAQEHCDRHGLRLRPHTKTHKSLRLALLQERQGARGITVAKLGEAEAMADGGLRDILIAYPILGAEKEHRLAALAERCRVTVALDSWESACCVAAAGRAAGQPIGILVEVDTGLGRVGLPPGDPAVDFCRRVAGLQGAVWRGLQTYQGHVKGTPEERAAKLEREDALLRSLLEALGAAGLAPEVVSGGSTPTLYDSQRVSALTEVRPGTYVFNDTNEVATGSYDWGDCALRVLVTVVSTAVPGRMVLDGGSKTFSSDRPAFGGEGFGRVVEDPELTIEWLNEEHAVVDRSRSTRPYAVGDRLSVIPNHACTCVNLHDGFWVHRGGNVEDRWPVDARGKVR